MPRVFDFFRVCLILHMLFLFMVKTLDMNLGFYSYRSNALRMFLELFFEDLLSRLFLERIYMLIAHWRNQGIS